MLHIICMSSVEGVEGRDLDLFDQPVRPSLSFEEREAFQEREAALSAGWQHYTDALNELGGEDGTQVTQEQITNFMGAAQEFRRSQLAMLDLDEPAEGLTSPPDFTTEEGRAAAIDFFEHSEATKLLRWMVAAVGKLDTDREKRLYPATIAFIGEFSSSKQSQYI